MLLRAFRISSGGCAPLNRTAHLQRAAQAAIRLQSNARHAHQLVLRSSATPARLFHSSRSPLLSSSVSSSSDLSSQLDSLGRQFADARMDIEDALESAGSTYFPDDIDAAQESVKATLQLYEQIQAAMPEAEATKLRESWSMRMEQLKQELEQALHAG